MYDFLICNAQIVDGTGKAAFLGDVAMEKGRIAAVGQLQSCPAAQTIDAQGRTLTPGFIDIHRHADAALFRPNFGRAELRQGLTTVINGNCGLSLAPCAGPQADALRAYLLPIVGEAPRREFLRLRDYFAAAREISTPLHSGMLVGMGTLRAQVSGFGAAPLREGQYRQLHRLLEEALSDGALGASLGLGYAPECFYTPGELHRALAPLRRSGIPVCVHMRQEGSGVVDALEEMIALCRALETPVEISHLKGMGKENWGRAVPRMLELLAQARAEGLDISCDLYPYTAGSTQLIHILPPECQHGGTEELTRRLSEHTFRRELRRRMETGTDFENISLLVGFENIVATSVLGEQNRELVGLSLAEIARKQGKDPFDALFDLLEEEHCQVSMIDFIAQEEDIAAILRDSHSCVISDSTYPSQGRRHPRVNGTYPRLLETYVREKGILTLEEAVRKCTALPAARLGLMGKGVVSVGADADLCLFFRENIHATANYQNPDGLAEGMDWVFVAGQPAIAEGSFLPHGRGKVLCAGSRDLSS